MHEPLHQYAALMQAARVQSTPGWLDSPTSSATAACLCWHLSTSMMDALLEGSAATWHPGRGEALLQLLLCTCATALTNVVTAITSCMWPRRWQIRLSRS